MLLNSPLYDKLTEKIPRTLYLKSEQKSNYPNLSSIRLYSPLYQQLLKPNKEKKE
jgi:hypothetical protein